MNTVTTIWEYEEKLRKLSFFIPKPPVPAVENEVQIASNTFISPKRRRTN